jgi:hypothetical protein
MGLSSDERRELGYAKSLLENPGLAVKITNIIGAPIERGFTMLPAKWSGAVNRATQAALRKALDAAVATVDDSGPRRSADALHRMIVAATGATGGAFGLPALLVELPVSTTIMLRSIVDVARSQGERIKEIETKLACIEVFALGGPSKRDDAAETGYFAVRAALAATVSEAAQYIAERGLAQEGAPALVRFIAQIAARFGVVVSEKAAAQAVPVIGAVGGAAINLIFIKHFQDMARGHFIVRRLERAHGQDVVRAEYEAMATELAGPPV